MGGGAMSRWFRHYAGMMRDEKLVRVAVRSKQPVERVVWVWGAILESAAEINDAGRYEFDAGEAAYFLRCDESELLDIHAALIALGRISDSVVERWGDRQFDSDKSKDRQKRYRERQQASRLSRGDVTPPSRDGELTAQETDTETDQIVGSDEPTSPEPGKPAPVAVIGLPTVSDGDFPVFEADIAEWSSAFPAVDVRQQLAAMRQWLLANSTRRKTKRGMRKFVVSWLDRRQNAGPSQPSAQRATAPPGRRMNAVEAYLSLREPPDEPAGRTIDHRDDELLPADKPGLPRAVADLAQAMRWPDGSGHH